MCLFTAPLHCIYMYSHPRAVGHWTSFTAAAASLVLCSVAPQQQLWKHCSFTFLTQTFLSGTAFQSHTQSVCCFNLQAATAIDLTKFTELHKRLTPLVVNGKRGHSYKLCETVRDKTLCFFPFIFYGLICLFLF